MLSFSHFLSFLSILVPSSFCYFSS
jgi:hypothetical protein